MAYKIRLDLNKIDEKTLFKAFENSVIEAENDYIAKKKSKNEEIDYWKMSESIGKRKKVYLYSRLMLAKVFHSGNVLNMHAVNKATQNLLKEVENELNK